MSDRPRVTSTPPAPGAPVPHTIAVHGRQFAYDKRFHEPWWEKVVAGVWEPETFVIFDTFIKSGIRPGGTLIDIGAWIGPTVLYGATLADRVVAFEPDPAALRILKCNIAANPGLAGKIELHEAALGTFDGTAPIFNNAPGNSGTSLLSRFGYAEVQEQKPFADVTILDARRFLAETPMENVSLIKIDVEGAEYDLVPYMAEALRRHRPTLHVSLHPFNLFFGDDAADAKGRLDKTLALLDALAGYRFAYVYAPERGTMARLAGPEAVAERVRSRGPALSSFVVSEVEAFDPA